MAAPTGRDVEPQERVDIVIVGGGMGGGVLAFLAAARGRQVIVLDRHHDGLHTAPRGELIQPNGLRIFDRLGLLDGLEHEDVARIQRFHFHRMGRSRLVTIDYAQLPAPFNYTLNGRPVAVMRPLLRRLADEPNVQLRWGHEFVNVVREHGRVVGVEARAGDRSYRIEAAVVIGADGPGSPVRRALGLPAKITTYRDGYLTMILPRPTGFGDDGRYYVGRREILGVFPSGAESIYLFYLSPTGQRKALEARGLDAFKAVLAAIDLDLAPSLRDLTAWAQVGWRPCIKVVASRWVDDGAALLGDAAHAFNPHVAQGRNQALEDAVALDTVLESCFQAQRFDRAALAPYETTRRAKVEVLQGLGDEMTLFWNTGNPFTGLIRDRVFATLDRKDDLRLKMLELVAGLSYRPYTMWDRIRAIGWP